jgi:hypothetical protein
MKPINFSPTPFFLLTCHLAIMAKGVLDFRLWKKYIVATIDGLVKSLLGRHPGESRGPEHVEITGFRLSPE